MSVIARAGWRVLTRNRAALRRRQRRALAGGAPRVLEIGSGSRRGRSFPQSAIDLAGPGIEFVMSDIDPAFGHRVVDVTDPDRALGTFDLVLCCNVLEHVLDIPAAVDGLSRLTGPTGSVLASTPFVYPLHDEPSDYWRPTEHALRAMFERRFGMVEVSWTGLRRFPTQLYVVARLPRRT